MTFSSFDEFYFMASIESKRVPRSGNFSFRNRKKANGARYGEGWSMVFVAFLALRLNASPTPVEIVEPRGAPSSYAVLNKFHEPTCWKF